MANNISTSPHSWVLSLESCFKNHQSSINNLQSTIFNLQLTIFNPPLPKKVRSGKSLFIIRYSKYKFNSSMQGNLFTPTFLRASTFPLQTPKIHSCIRGQQYFDFPRFLSLESWILLQKSSIFNQQSSIFNQQSSTRPYLRRYVRASRYSLFVNQSANSLHLYKIT